MSINVTPIPRLIDLAAPAFTLGTANAAGSAATAVASDSTLLAFDATVPTTIAYSATAAVGSATVTSRRDHTHGMAASTPTVVEAIFFTRTAAAASGAVTYGGAGGTPAGAIVVARSTTTASSLSIGVTEGDLTDHAVGYYAFDATPIGTSNSSQDVFSVNAAGDAQQYGQMSAWTTTGGTITWTKVGAGQAVSGYIIWIR